MIFNIDVYGSWLNRFSIMFIDFIPILREGSSSRPQTSHDTNVFEEF